MENISTRHKAVRALIVFFLLLSMSCATGKYLKTETVQGVDIRGTATVYLYYEFDWGSIVFIDIEGDEYDYKMTSSEFHYTKKRNLTAEQAINEASNYISTYRKKWSAVVDSGGKIIGYEVKPIFQINSFGEPDIFETRYKSEGNVIKVSADLKQTLKGMYNEEKYGGR